MAPLLPRLLSYTPHSLLVRIFSSLPPPRPPIPAAPAHPTPKPTSTSPASLPASASVSTPTSAKADPSSPSTASVDKPSEKLSSDSGASPKGPVLTLAEQDAVAHQAMLDRDGGASSLQLEDGQYFGMKRNVKDNMFRLM